jgi:hypothetical protein
MRALAVALAALGALAGAPRVRAESLAVQGSCRDGVPHGAWQLASPDGHLRAIGAFAQGKRTGSFIFWDARGVRVAHVPYEDEAKSGTLALWYAEGARDGAGPQRLEAPYAQGMLNGTKRSWYRNGRLRTEAVYRAGRLVEVRGWDERGAPLDAASARSRAEDELRAEETTYARLDALVMEHLPRCDPRSPPKPQ